MTFPHWQLAWPDLTRKLESSFTSFSTLNSFARSASASQFSTFLELEAEKVESISRKTVAQSDLGLER